MLGLLEPADVTRIREKLGLSKQRAGAILGGGRNAFGRFETSEVNVSQSMANLLRLLDHRPRLLETLQNLKLREDEKRFGGDTALHRYIRREQRRNMMKVPR